MTQIFKKISMFVLAATLLLVASAQVAAATPVTNFAAVVCSGTDKHLGDTDGTGRNTIDNNVCCPDGSQASGTRCFFGKYVNPVIALLSAAVMIVVIVSIIVAGIQYSSAQGDPSKIQAAKQRIVQSLIALFVFIFLFAALNWLIPGGLI